MLMQRKVTQSPQIDFSILLALIVFYLCGSHKSVMVLETDAWYAGSIVFDSNVTSIPCVFIK